jgi:hypothetical protein
MVRWRYGLSGLACSGPRYRRARPGLDPQEPAAGIIQDLSTHAFPAARPRCETPAQDHVADAALDQTRQPRPIALVASSMPSARCEMRNSSLDHPRGRRVDALALARTGPGELAQGEVLGEPHVVSPGSS